MSTLSSITGIVIDENNDPLPGVMLKAESPDSDVDYTTVSLQDGTFVLRDLPSNQHLLMATMEGFMDWKKPVTVGPEGTFSARITMYSE